MLWLWPSSDTALAASTQLSVLPELSNEETAKGWAVLSFARDFPIDYSLLLENLTDPDHGLFAHQMAGFDLFSGGPQHPMDIDITIADGRPEIVGRTAAVEKLTAGSAATKKKKEKQEKKEKKGAASEKPRTSVISFQAPCHLKWSRVDDEGLAPIFSAFWAIPTGVGRSRLMLRFVRSSMLWLQIPVWLYGIVSNGFVDQDSYLLATQQPYTLEAELRALKAKEHGSSSHDGSADSQGPTKRKEMFSYNSSSDKLQLAIGRWIDVAVPRMPGRTAARLALHASSGGGEEILPQARREAVLDRWTGHTMVCPNAMDAYVRFCLAAKVFGVLAAVIAVWEIGFVAATKYAARSGTMSVLELVPPPLHLLLLLALIAASYACHRISRQFKYVQTPEVQRKQLARITGLTDHLGTSAAPSAKQEAEQNPLAR